MFAFDKVLKPNVSQEFVYTVSAKPIVAGKEIHLSYEPAHNISVLFTYAGMGFISTPSYILIYKIAPNN